MQQGTFWNANSSSAIQKIPQILWNPRFHHRVHNSLPSVPIPGKISSIKTHPLPWNTFYYYPPIYAWVFQVVSCCKFYPQVNCMHLYSPPYVINSPAISFSLIWSSHVCMGRCGNREATQYTVFSIPLSPLSFSIQICSPLPNSVLPSLRQTKFYTRTKQQAKLCLCVFQPL